MGLKLEIVLILAIVVILIGSFTTELSNDITQKNLSTKELEFTETTFIEVDTNRTQGVAYSRYGVRKNAILTLHDITYHTDNLKKLSAKRGRYEGDKVYLDDEIKIDQKEGFDYRMQHAVYDKKTEILEITSPFTAQMGQNTIKGEHLHYNARKKEAYAKQIDAVVYTVEK
jgi:hypothetical protein